MMLGKYGSPADEQADFREKIISRSSVETQAGVDTVSSSTQTDSTGDKLNTLFCLMNTRDQVSYTLSPTYPVAACQF